MKFTLILFVVAIAVVCDATPDEKADQGNGSSKRTSRQFGLWSPYYGGHQQFGGYQPHGFYQPYYQPYQPYQASKYYPIADQPFVQQQEKPQLVAAPVKESSEDASLSFLKKVSELNDLKAASGVQQKTEWTADGRLCIRPLLNLLGLFTTTTARPSTCPPAPTCPAAASNLALTTAITGVSPAAAIATTAVMTATSATSGSLTGSTPPGGVNVVAISTAPGFNKIKVTCTSVAVFSVLGAGTLTANVEATSASNFVYIVATNPTATDKCTWIQIS